MNDACIEYPCDLCGSDDAVEVPYARLYTGDQPLHICRHCGFVYVRRRRDALAVARTWSEEIFGQGYTARIPAVLARQIYVADFIDVEVGLEGKSVVDIGAGEGQFLELVRDRYKAHPFGLEPSPANCARLREAGFGCFQGVVEEYAAQHRKERFDVATIMWTLENCVSCLDMLRAARAMVAPEGHVAVATGSRILTPFKKPLDYYLEPTPADTHCFRFSASTLRGALCQAGLRPVRVNRYIDTDYLVVLAKPEGDGTPLPWRGDDWLRVYDFFERWHRESVHYRLEEPPEVCFTPRPRE